MFRGAYLIARNLVAAALTYGVFYLLHYDSPAAFILALGLGLLAAELWSANSEKVRRSPPKPRPEFIELSLLAQLNLTGAGYTADTLTNNPPPT